jgi:hypothetical protein
MSIEYTIYCNGCGRIVEANPASAAEARRAVREMGGKVNLPGVKDLCRECVTEGRQPE